jgi:hypothetical protein
MWQRGLDSSLWGTESATGSCDAVTNITHSSFQRDTTAPSQRCYYCVTIARSPYSLPLWSLKFTLKNQFPISQKIHCVSITKTSLIMLFRKIITLLSASHETHKNTVLLNINACKHTLPWLAEMLHIYMTINMMVPLYYSLCLHIIPQAKIDQVLRHCPF